MAEYSEPVIVPVRPQLDTAAAAKAGRDLNRYLTPAEVDAKLAGIQKGITGIGTAAVSTGKKVRSTQNEVLTLNERLERFGSGLSGYFTRFASFTVAAGAVFRGYDQIAKATDKFLTFDNRLVRLKQLTGSTRNELKNLATESFRLGTSLGVSSEALLESAEVLAQAGFSAREAKIALEALAKADTAPTFDNMTQTTDGLLAILKQFNKEVGESEKVLSQLNAVAAHFPVESDDIIKAVQRAGGVLAQSGSSFEEFIALFTAIRQTTREAPETIAQGLKTIAVRLQRVSTANFLERMGIKGIRDEATKEFVGVYKSFEILSNALRNTSTKSPEYSAIVEELGGIRQVGKVLPLITNFSVAQKAYQTALGGSNSLTKDSLIAQESLQRQFAKTGEEFTKLLNIFFENKSIRDTIVQFNDLAQSLIKFVQALEPIFPMLTLLGASTLLRFAVPITKGALFKNRPKGRKIEDVLGTGLAGGGMIPGRSYKDDYPALLMRGEYVVSQRGVDTVGKDFLDVINSGNVPKFARGSGSYKRKFNTQVEQEIQNLRSTLPIQEVAQLGSLGHLRSIAEKTVLQREASTLQEESSRLRNLEQTGIYNPLKIRGLTQKTIGREPLPPIPLEDIPTLPPIPSFLSSQPAPNIPLSIEDIDLSSREAQLRQAQAQRQARVFASTGRSKYDIIGPPVDTGEFTTNQSNTRDRYRAQRSAQRTIARGTGEFTTRGQRVIPQPKINLLGSSFATDSSIEQYLGNFPKGRPPSRTPVPQGTTTEIFQQLRKADPNLGAKEALAEARKFTQAANSIENLTTKEKARLLPLYKDQYKYVKEQNTLFPTFNKVITNTRDFLSKGIRRSDKGLLPQIPRFTHKVGAGVQSSAGLLLLASASPQFDAFSDSLTGGGRRGAGFSSGVRGGLAGAAIGAAYGPHAALLGAFGGALFGATNALKAFDKQTRDTKFDASLQSFLDKLKPDEPDKPTKPFIGDLNQTLADFAIKTTTNFQEQNTDQLSEIYKSIFGGFDRGVRRLLPTLDPKGRDEELAIQDLPRSPFKTETELTAAYNTKFLEQAQATGLDKGVEARIQEFINKGGNIEDLRKEFEVSVPYNIPGERGQASKLGIKKETVTLERVLSIFSGKTQEEATAWLENLVKERDARAEAAKHTLVTVTSFKNLSVTLNEFSNRLNFITDNLPDLRIKTLADPASLIETFRGLSKPGTREFATDVGKLPISPADKAIGLKLNQTRVVLRDVLTNIHRDPGVTSENFATEFRKGLEKRLGKGQIVEALVRSVGQKEDFDKFRESLTSGINKPLEDLFQKAGFAEKEQQLQRVGQALTEFFSTIVSNTRRLLELAGSFDDARLDATRTSLGRRRDIDKVLGRPTTPGLDDRLVASSVAATFGTADPRVLGDMVTHFDALGKTIPAYREASEYVITALKKLADSSSRTGDIMTRLSEVESSRAAKIGLREKFITGDPASRRLLTLNTTLAKGFVETGARPSVFNRLNIRFQKAIIEGLKEFGEGRIGGGPTGSKVLSDTLGVGLEETTERDKLIADLRRVYASADSAGHVLVERTRSVYSDFLEKYRVAHSDFLTRFHAIVRDPRIPVFTPPVPARSAPPAPASRKPPPISVMPAPAFGGGGFFAIGEDSSDIKHKSSDLDRFNREFGLNVEKLNLATAAIPHTIAMNVNHKIEVIHNGAQVFAELQPSIVAVASATVKQAISNLIKTKFPDVGPMADIDGIGK